MRLRDALLRVFEARCGSFRDDRLERSALRVPLRTLVVEPDPGASEAEFGVPGSERNAYSLDVLVSRLRASCDEASMHYAQQERRRVAAASAAPRFGVGSV